MGGQEWERQGDLFEDIEIDLTMTSRNSMFN
jgi:hypothetical protein